MATRKLKRQPPVEPASKDEQLAKITLWYEPKPLQGEPNRTVLYAAVEHPALLERALFQAPAAAAALFGAAIDKVIADGLVVVEP